MLYVLPAVTVSFEKQSTNAAITSGNGTYQLNGATFDIFESASDARVGTIQMDEHGRAQATLLPNTAYYLVETKAPAGYMPRRDRIEFSTSSDGGHVSIVETPGTISLRIVKLDKATGAGPQAGASLAGAEFTCVSQSTPGWTRILTTDDDGMATLDDIPLGTFTIYESKAPEGYLLPSETWSYSVDADQLGDTGVVELESRISDTPIAFDLEISKFKDHGDSSESGIEQPAEGVVFEVVSNSSQQVVGTLTTNVYGFASTKDQPDAWFGGGTRPEGVHGSIPYDRAGYTVREVRETVPDGFKQAGEWSISAEQTTDGATLQYIVDNHAISTHLQIVKRDARTGSAVPLAGFAFQLLDSNHEPVSQTCWYPAHSVLNTFTTDKTGSVTLPESLRPGIYYIREKDAAAPYLRGEDLELSIPVDMSLTPVAIASFYDQAATGKIEIVKSDAVDSSALAGAVFEIRAAEDIARADGSMVALAGETVATVETDEQGKADINGLSLGSGIAHYEVVEVSAPEGYLLDPTPHAVELTHADQDTPVIHARVEVSNDYTKVDISKADVADQTEIEGAQLVLLDANGETIETWISTATPHRIEHLAPGSYTLRETMSPRTYDTAEDVTFEVKETGDIQKVVMNDAPIEIIGRVDKRQEIAQPVASDLTANGDGKNRAATQSDARGEFAYTIDARNESKTWVDEFTITDELKCVSTGTARLVSIETPVATGDYDGRCNIWYRTSPEIEQDSEEQANATLDNGHENPWLETDEVKNLLGEDTRLVDYDGWHLWKSDISTSESTTLTVNDLNLPRNTQVTGLRIEYGSVSADFTTRSDTSTWSRDDLKDEHDDLDDAARSLDSQAHGALVHMTATASYMPENAITNGVRVDLCRNGGGNKLESHDEDHVIQRCALSQDLPSTGSAPLAALMTALMTAGGAAIWFAKNRSAAVTR